MNLQQCVELAKEKGSSSWLSAVPIELHGFYLKSDFHDVLCLRYDWSLLNVPRHCHCGKIFSVDHAMICPTGGIPTLHHNEICNFTASLLSEVCHNVAIEPSLQPLSGEIFSHRTANVDDGAHADVRARGF